MVEKKRINAHVPIDEKRLFLAVLEESDATSQREWIMRHAREDAEEFGIDDEADVATILDDEDEEPGIAETYDPDEFEGLLDKEQINELLDAGIEEVNPDHVDRHTAGAPQGSAVPLATAAARYELDEVTRDNVKTLCRRMGFDTKYYLENGANDRNVPGTIVKRLGGDGKTTETVTTYEPTEILQQAAAASLLQVDAGEEKLALRKMVANTRSAMKQHKDEIRDQLDEEAAYDVMSTAMYRLSDDSSGKLSMDGYDADEIAQINWPRTPGELVDWYVDTKGNELEGGVARGEVAVEIAEHVRGGVPSPIIEEDGTHVTAGTWMDSAERMAANDDLPIVPMEQHLERAEAALEERPEHPAADRLREAVEEFREEVEERRTEAEA